MFVRITGYDENGKDYEPLYVNVTEILSFYKEKGGSVVELRSGKKVTVKESPKQIIQQLSDQRK